ncbi:benomyl/methotrexate resistance protein [Colletotrichum cuscutae]|uniref:Benomyl/methotrexate resistance protein n=1 Tax=Colletotrichum cuscutae TaxID=1209917 RepID=A0AAI9VHP3_9PEZI|nr:benomyl/methotrexate resistance protein [Colletotrichum cuscutae]
MHRQILLHIPFCHPKTYSGTLGAPDVHWIMPIIGSASFSIGSFLLFNSVVNYLPDAYPNVAASALAGNDFFRSVFGAGFRLFANEISLLGFLPILLLNGRSETAQRVQQTSSWFPSTRS